LKIETVGRPIFNPVSKFGTSTRIYFNTFVVKYYTWANDDNPPAIFASSDDYCFRKADATFLSGTAFLQYDSASTTAGPHDLVQFSE